MLSSSSARSRCLSRRQALLLGGAAAGLALTGCQFTPALAPGGAVRALSGQVQVAAPRSEVGFVMTRRLEERLGRGGQTAPFVLDYSLSLNESGFGTDRDGSNQRAQITGRALYRLARRGESGALTQGSVQSFTGYSSTGNTVTTSASREDARRRLVMILADEIMERLLLSSPDLVL